MVKLSLPTWDRDKSQYQAGTSFTPSFAGRLKPSVPSTSSVLRRFKSADSTAPSQPASHPLMTLRLSSPSFLDSVVHDGSSDNPLYVLDTDDNVTKVRRSDPKGFINVSRVRWPADIHKLSSRKIKDFAGIEVAFGRGSWKPANEFLGNPYGSFSSYRKFYIPHHQPSLRWRRSGPHYICTTETVKGPVAILEPAMQREFPQLKILDPLFRLGSSRPQRMHNGLPLSLLDFLLVTAMLLVTPADEWMNVTRTNPSEPPPDASYLPSGTSLGNLQSSDTRPFNDTLPSKTPDVEDPLHTSKATPAIERWRSNIPVRAMEDNLSHYEESIDGRSSSTASRSTSRLSSHIDMQSATQHSSNVSAQEVYSTQSCSSVSLVSRTLSSSHPARRRTPSSHISRISYMTHGRVSQEDPRPPVINPTSVPSRLVTASPTSSIHTRSLPIPPTPSRPKVRLPSLPAPRSAVALIPPSRLPEPIPSVPQHPLLSRSRSYTHLQNASAYSELPHDYVSPTKAPPNYDASAHDRPPLPTSAHVATQRAVASRSLSIRTANVAPAPSAASASTSSTVTSLASEEGDPYDMPPAYSALDMARSPLRLRVVNGALGGGE
ncbi:hypothetical protein BJV78DRAFT_655071 [Lactifluus subvellereus]|nr:hypothetical protein BJV78DRAFT_655071 [Lactifluus subvellereus]